MSSGSESIRDSTTSVPTRVSAQSWHDWFRNAKFCRQKKLASEFLGTFNSFLEVNNYA
jgi:hypothetical protein